MTVNRFKEIVINCANKLLPTLIGKRIEFEWTLVLASRITNENRKIEIELPSDFYFDSIFSRNNEIVIKGFSKSMIKNSLKRVYFVGTNQEFPVGLHYNTIIKQFGIEWKVFTD